MNAYGRWDHPLNKGLQGTVVAYFYAPEINFNASTGVLSVNPAHVWHSGGDGLVPTDIYLLK